MFSGLTIEQAFELLQALILGAQFVFLLIVGKKYRLDRIKGWKLITLGTALICFGSVIDWTDGLGELSRELGEKYLIIGNSLAESFLEDVVGYLLGFSLTLAGLRSWIPLVARQVRTDALTGLNNRSMFEEELSFLLKQRQGFAIILMNLENFSDVNDRFGLAVGDATLQAVARQFKAVVSGSNMLARIAGDEFAVLLPGIVDEGQAVAKAERLLSTIDQPLIIGNVLLNIKASVGVNCVTPEMNLSKSEIINNIGLALQKSRTLPGSQITVFSAVLRENHDNFLRIAKDIETALTTNELYLAYQPIIESKSGLTCELEALLRWRHPKRGIVSPAEFIPVAEKSGHILKLGEWVLKKACQDVIYLQKNGHDNIRLLVNISAIQVMQKSFMARFYAILDEAGVLPDKIGLEITEGLLLNPEPYILQTLEDMRDRGIRISIDDFGTGYSSWHYLRELPVSTLKIDKCFISDLGQVNGSENIIKAMIKVAHALNMDVVAEGVETEGQAGFLVDQGCDKLQGYLKGKPMPMSQILELLSPK